MRAPERISSPAPAGNRTPVVQPVSIHNKYTYMPYKCFFFGSYIIYEGEKHDLCNAAELCNTLIFHICAILCAFYAYFFI
jgi:hypothetical protein